MRFLESDVLSFLDESLFAKTKLWKFLAVTKFQTKFQRSVCSSGGH